MMGLFFFFNLFFKHSSYFQCLWKGFTFSSEGVWRSRGLYINIKPTVLQGASQVSLTSSGASGSLFLNSKANAALC